MSLYLRLYRRWKKNWLLIIYMFEFQEYFQELCIQDQTQSWHSANERIYIFMSIFCGFFINILICHISGEFKFQYSENLLFMTFYLTEDTEFFHTWICPFLECPGFISIHLITFQNVWQQKKNYRYRLNIPTCKYKNETITEKIIWIWWKCSDRRPLCLVHRAHIV